MPPTRISKKRKLSDAETSSSDEEFHRNGVSDLSGSEVEEDDDLEGDESDMEQETDISSDDDDDDGNNEDDGDEDDDDNDSNTSADKESTLKPAVEELDKAKAVMSQLRFWEHLLKMRVNLQKAMVIINQLPQCERLHEMLSETGESCQKAVANGRAGVKRLLDQLFEIESSLLSANPETKSLLSDGNHQNSETKTVAGNEDDEEITSESEPGSEDEEMSIESSSQHAKTVKTSEYSQLIAKRHKALEKYRINTIQKWATKTQALSKFAAFDQSVAKQIQQTLEDKSRLVARTRVNRLGNRILGKAPVPVVSEALDTPAPVGGDQDAEIFDDNDFYHHILREFIQYKNSYDPIVLTKQWLEIQQYRKKAKKSVDRKASKGRKTRYNVHKPLINFMAPITSPDAWTNEQRDDLFKNLFGRSLVGAS